MNHGIIQHTLLGFHRDFQLRMGINVHSGALYLTKPYGIVVGLGSRVEVDGLFDIVMALVVSGQVVWRCPVTRVIGYLRCLVWKKGSHFNAICIHIWQLISHVLYYRIVTSKCKFFPITYDKCYVTPLIQIHLLNVPHVAVDSNQGEVILGTLIETQRWIHVRLALQVLGPPLVDVPEWRRWLHRCTLVYAYSMRSMTRCLPSGETYLSFILLT